MDEKKIDKDKPELEGEGSYSGTKKYDQEAEKFAREEDVEKLGKEAEKDVDRDKRSYDEAEKIGKSKIAEEDPELRR